MTETSLPPGPSAPIPWQALRWIVRPGAFMRECRDRYGDTFTIKLPQEDPWVMITRPESVEQVFKGPSDVLHAGEGNAILGPVLGASSVLLLDGAQHMRQRKLMLPPFHGARMHRFRDVMSEVAERELARWPLGEPVRSHTHMQAVTLEVIMRAVFGIEEGERLDRCREALRELLDWAGVPWMLVVGAILGVERLAEDRVIGFGRTKERADTILYEEIRDRRGDPTAPERDDMLSMLLQARDEDGEPMTDEELRDELMTLLVAGHETTATALAWTLELLNRHPHALRRLEAEVDAGGDEYLDAVIRESLRLRPIIPIVARHLTEPWELEGRLLPAGVSVCPCIFLMHRREDVYPDPDSFRPERFLHEPPGTYTWIPFGGGVRRCLGASFALFEMNVVLKTMLGEARLRPVPGPPERIRRRAITFHPSRGGTVVLSKKAPHEHPAREAEALIKG